MPPAWSMQPRPRSRVAVGGPPVVLVVGRRRARTDGPEPISPRTAEETQLIELGRELFVRQWVPNDSEPAGAMDRGLSITSGRAPAAYHQTGPGGGGAVTRTLRSSPHSSPLPTGPAHRVSFTHSRSTTGPTGLITDRQPRVRRIVPGAAAHRSRRSRKSPSGLVQRTKRSSAPLRQR